MEQIENYFPGLTARQQEQFAALEGLYAEWNARINVVSRREMASGEFMVRHVLHSLAIARACRGSEAGGPVCRFEAGMRVIDVGTGGGFPAVPLAIMFPEVHFTAVDSIGKKIRVVEEIARAAGIANLTPVCGRVESLHGRWEWAVSRAVAPAATMLGWVWPAVSRGVVLLKGGELEQELAETGRRCDVRNIAEWFDEPFFETKKVILIEK